MRLNKDLKEFIELLNSNKVEYLVVGAFAVAWHGRPRFTADIDFFLRPSRENATAVLADQHGEEETIRIISACAANNRERRIYLQQAGQ